MRRRCPAPSSVRASPRTVPCRCPGCDRGFSRGRSVRECPLPHVRIRGYSAVGRCRPLFRPARRGGRNRKRPVPERFRKTAGAGVSATSCGGCSLRRHPAVARRGKPSGALPFCGLPEGRTAKIRSALPARRRRAAAAGYFRPFGFGGRLPELGRAPDRCRFPELGRFPDRRLSELSGRCRFSACREETSGAFSWNRGRPELFGRDCPGISAAGVCRRFRPAARSPKK